MVRNTISGTHATGSVGSEDKEDTFVDVRKDKEEIQRRSEEQRPARV
jgi:hypothetical protein